MFRVRSNLSIQILSCTGRGTLWKGGFDEVLTLDEQYVFRLVPALCLSQNPPISKARVRFSFSNLPFSLHLP
jgi:hypothetical protein